jgi:hypothetical protein
MATPFKDYGKIHKYVSMKWIERLLKDVSERDIKFYNDMVDRIKKRNKTEAEKPGNFGVTEGEWKVLDRLSRGNVEQYPVKS